jgi:hypothetical protein
MATPFSGPGFKPEALYAASAEGFLELLKSFAAPGAGAAAATDWSQFAAPLAQQFEQWLRLSQSAGPWFAGPAGVSAGMGPAFAGAQGWSFGPLPLGAAAAARPEAQRTFDLLTQLAQLQARLAGHWGEIARNAAQRFVARAGTPQASASLDESLKLYELWVACAEEAYAITARSEDFSRLQAELANVSAALLVEQRRHAEGLVRAFGLPTRNEVDALYAHIKELTRRLDELRAASVGPVAPPPPAAHPRGRPKVKAKAKRTAGGRGRHS